MTKDTGKIEYVKPMEVDWKAIALRLIGFCDALALNDNRLCDPIHKIKQDHGLESKASFIIEGI